MQKKKISKKKSFSSPLTLPIGFHWLSTNFFAFSKVHDKGTVPVPWKEIQQDIKANQD